MLAQNMTPIGIMKVVNKFILIKNLPDEFISISTIRRVRKKLLKRKIKEQAERVKGQFYIGCDARKDKTLFPKNQILPEEHMTFVSPSGYISHEVLESKKSAVVSKKIIKTIDDTNSRQSLKILAMDGEAVNTGVHTG